MKRYFPLLILTSLISVMVLYRAVTLSMTWDEAYTVTVYASQGGNIFSAEHFLPNNHILHSILVWLLFQLAPWQEWAMRLPACLGTFGCLFVLWRLGAFLFQPSDHRVEKKPAKSVTGPLVGTFFLIALVSFHPLVFQFYSFARGYGLSLCFSLFGFYYLLKSSEQNLSGRLLVFSGIAFGLSVAFNLSSALMNTGIILAALLQWAWSNRIDKTAIKAIFLQFCLPGAILVAVLYVPIFAFVSLNVANYATGSLIESILDLSLWSFGHSNIVPDESLTRIFLGYPISVDIFWTLIVLIPLFVFLPILLTGITLAFSTIRQQTKTNCRLLDEAIGIISFGLLYYCILLCMLDGFGKTAFPKDRTGIFPIVFFLILAVLLFYRLKFESVSNASRLFGNALLVGLIVSLSHFLSLFSLPYYHNFWYADAEMKQVMFEVKQSESDQQIFVCTKLNIASAEYYAKKYHMENTKILCTQSIEDPIHWARSQQRVFFYLPGDSEQMLKEVDSRIQIRSKTPHLGLIFVEKPAR